MSDEKRKPEDVKREMEVLSSIVNALAPLSKDERSRILRYVRDFFGIYMGEP